MYGTVARFRLKPGMEEKLKALGREWEKRPVAGAVMDVVYRMDADANEYYLTAVFESKTAYLANADSPEQNAEYLQFRELMDGEPEWHDGEIIYIRR